MEKITFIKYLTELMVSDDPVQAMKDVKQSSRNPDNYKRQQQADNVDDQRNVQTDKEDPNKSEKLRIIKMKQQLNRSEKRLQQKQEQMARRAGVEPGGEEMQ